MLNIEYYKEKILSFFDKEKITVLYFNNLEFHNTNTEKPIELAIKINSEDTSKWKYFEKKVNSCGKVIYTVYKDEILKFIFEGSNNEYEREVLLRNLEAFYNSLEKKYFTVCPQVASFSVLVKPTHRCNLDCKYCYDKPFRELIKEDMTMDVLDKLLKLLSEYTEDIQFIWHGGEPTMVGLEWYERAYKEIFPKYPMLNYKFGLMSNGVNINKKWIDFFKKNNIEAGVSYNANYQTKLRCSNQLKENEELDYKLSNKIKNMLISAKKDGFNIGVIDVVTALNYKNQIETYEFYKKIGISVNLNAIFHTRQTEKNNLEVSSKDFSDEFLKYFKYWLFDKEGVSERSAYEALALVIGAKKLCCKNEDCRLKWLGINPLGDIYPCDRYVPDEYKMGSIFEFDSISDIFKSNAYQKYYNDIQKRFDGICKKCGFWFACKGGCNASSTEVSGNADGVEEFYCETFRQIYMGVYEILRDIDWIDNEELNPVVRRLFIENGFYSIKEIRQFIKDSKLDFQLVYDKNNFLECSEYQVFRGINRMYDDPCHSQGHIDFIDSFDKTKVKMNKDLKRKDLIEYLKKEVINMVNSINYK